MTKELKFNELRQLAKANGIPTPVGISTEGLKKILSERGLLNLSEIKIEPKKKETIQKEEMIKIPDELKHLGLTPVKKINRLEEVNINNRLNTERKLKLPQSIEERLKAEGYTIHYPTTPFLQRVMERGGEYITKKDGSVFKIDSGQCDEKGERIYHIAMKIKKEIIEQENNLFRQRQSFKKKRVEKGEDLEGAKAELLKVDPKYIKFTEKNNNKL